MLASVTISSSGCTERLCENQLQVQELAEAWDIDYSMCYIFKIHNMGFGGT